MKNNNQIDKIIELLRVLLKKYIDSGQLKIEDNVLSFGVADELKINKFILDNGYEDPLTIDFSPVAPVLQVPLDEFGMNNNGANSEHVAQSMSDLLAALLKNTYQLEQKTLAGRSLYSIRVNNKIYKTEPRVGIIFETLIRLFGKVTTL